MDFLILEDGTDTLSRNVGKGLPFDTALYPRKAQFARIFLVRYFDSRRPRRKIAGLQISGNRILFFALTLKADIERAP
jgi:hypothetical protein